MSARRLRYTNKNNAEAGSTERLMKHPDMVESQQETETLRARVAELEAAGAQWRKAAATTIWLWIGW